MTVRATLIALLLSLAGIAPAAFAVDQAIEGKVLNLKRTSSGDKLVFVSKDTSFAFPAIGGADDPSAGSPGGIQVELFSVGEGVATPLTASAGAGNPGWLAKDGKRDFYRYRNTSAPSGPSPIKAVALKEGKRIKVVARSIGLPMLAPQRAVGIRLTLGTQRLCALFDAGTIKKDLAGGFRATNAGTAGLADCSDVSLGGPGCASQGGFLCGGDCPAGSVCDVDLTDMTGESCTCISDADPCGLTAPACNGVCDAGEVCTPIDGFPFPTCGCIPEGQNSCGGSKGLCGGACPTGQVCRYAESSFQSGCTCSPPGPCGGGGLDCGPGFFCAIATNLFICAPFECGGGATFPVCGGSSCGAGLECSAISAVVGGSPIFDGCLCAAPGPCDAAGAGLSCAAGEVCLVDDGVPGCVPSP